MNTKQNSWLPDVLELDWKVDELDWKVDEIEWDIEPIFFEPKQKKCEINVIES
jgi:hypothetical protein